MNLTPPDVTTFEQYATPERRVRLEQMAWHQLGLRANPLLSLNIAEEILRATWAYPRARGQDAHIDDCLDALTTLRAWQYRMWYGLGCPTAVQFVDVARAYAAKRPRLRLIDESPRSSTTTRTLAQPPVDWTQGRHLAKSAVRALEQLLPPVEWDAYEMVWYFGRDYALIGAQLDIPSDLVEEYCNRVAAVIESWLSPAQYFADLNPSFVEEP